MKHVLITCFGWLGSLLVAHAQPDLLQDIEDYHAALQHQRWSVAVDYLHPALFELTSREQMLAGYESREADSNMAISYTDMRLRQNPLAMTEGGIRYALLVIEYDLRMQLIGEDAETLDGTAAFYESLYEPGTFSYDPDSHLISLQVSTRMYAFLHPGWTAWRFLEDQEQTADLILNLVPKNVRTELMMGLNVERPSGRY